jgi:7-cyano-7-deazaguanine reductase
MSKQKKHEKADKQNKQETLTVSENNPVNDSENTVKYGERNIQDNQLITFPNPRIGREYRINIALPEFTCKCPFSGYPDFATIEVNYIPNEKVVELKAIKLYINSYRDCCISHEEAVNQILDDLVTACDPLEMTVKGDFSPRGNVHTVIEVSHIKNLKK